MIEMIQKKQWDRLSRNVALVVLLCVLAAVLSGCAKTIVDVKEGDKAVVDPSLLVKPKKAKPKTDKVNLSKHLREEAADKKRTGAIEDKLDSLQEFVKDSQKPTPGK